MIHPAPLQLWHSSLLMLQTPMPQARTTWPQILRTRLYIRDGRRAELAASGLEMPAHEAAFHARAVTEAEREIRREAPTAGVMPGWVVR